MYLLIETSHFYFEKNVALFMLKFVLDHNDYK